jgi:KDO2-lipid IV(A) lauroyltransferase
VAISSAAHICHRQPPADAAEGLPVRKERSVRRLWWRIEAILVRFLFAMARSLGIRRASVLGGAVARRIGPLLPVSDVARRNLELAFPASDAAWREGVVRDVWSSLGSTMLELPLVAALEETAAGPGWELVGRENMPAPGARAIYFSAHIGNWEVLPRAALRNSIVMGSFYRAPDNPLVDEELRRMRKGGAPLPLFPKGSKGARQALRHLSQGGVLGMLVDQKLNEGISLPFFGHPAMTAPALAEFALRYRCPVVPAHTRRIGPGRFRFVVEPPLPLPDSGDQAADVRALMLAVNGRYEAWIRENPGQWLWLHRRYPKPVYQPQPTTSSAPAA